MVAVETPSNLATWRCVMSCLLARLGDDALPIVIVPTEGSQPSQGALKSLARGPRGALQRFDRTHLVRQLTHAPQVAIVDEVGDTLKLSVQLAGFARDLESDERFTSSRRPAEQALAGLKCRPLGTVKGEPLNPV